MFSIWFSWYLIAIVFVFGSVIGSFLNVVIYRFHTGRSLAGDSHCLSCQRQLKWFELFPLISYFVLRGKCRTCHSYIPVRYVVVELLTAVSFVTVYKQTETLIEFSLLSALCAVLIIVLVYDVYHYIIPDELVVFLSVLAVTVFVITGWDSLSVVAAIYALLAAMVAFAFYGGLWKVSRGRWIGFGDAKLAIPLAFLVGFPAVFSMIVLSFWVGALVSIIIVSLQQLFKRGQNHLRIFGSPLTMKSEIPFAPFLIAGFVLSYVYGVDVLSLVAYVL